MIHILFFLTTLICALTSVCQISETISPHLAHDIFGNRGICLSEPSVETVEKLFQKINAASALELYVTTQEMITYLQRQLDKTHTLQEYIKQHKEIIPRELFYREFVLKQQLQHVKTYLEKIAQQVPLSTRIFTTIQQNFHSVLRYLPWTEKMHKDAAPESLASAVIAYVTMEWNLLLCDYEKLVHFLKVIQVRALPEIVNFWQSTDIKEQLKKRAQRIETAITIQGFEMLIGIAIQAIIMGAQSINLQWVDERDQQEFEALSKQVQEIAQAAQRERQEVAEKQQKDANTIMKTFFDTTFKELKEKGKKISDQYRQQVMYLNRSINLDQPAFKYVIEPIKADVRFEQAIMYVPGNYQWYNVYQINDWEYNPTTNSFWQYALSTFPISTTWGYPEINSIFTEYITGKAEYTIEIEFSIINATYPFFVGVMFNKARWISGDPEREFGYRLLGLYGTEQKTDSATTHAIKLAFGQTRLERKKGTDGTITESILTPLQQIAQSTEAPLYELPANIVTSLEHNPISFSIIITTRAKEILYTLSKKEVDSQGKTVITKLSSQTISSLDPYYFLYGGIGFMAPGCQAEFSIKQPQDLIPKEQDIATFKNNLGTELARQGV